MSEGPRANHNDQNAGRKVDVSLEDVEREVVGARKRPGCNDDEERGRQFGVAQHEDGGRGGAEDEEEGGLEVHH